MEVKCSTVVRRYIHYNARGSTQGASIILPNLTQILQHVFRHSLFYDLKHTPCSSATPPFLRRPKPCDSSTRPPCFFLPQLRAAMPKEWMQDPAVYHMSMIYRVGAISAHGSFVHGTLGRKGNPSLSPQSAFAAEARTACANNTSYPVPHRLIPIRNALTHHLLVLRRRSIRNWSDSLQPRNPVQSVCCFVHRRLH